MIEVSIEPRQLVAGRDVGLAVRFVNTGPDTCTDIVFRLSLPPEFVLLHGRNRVEISELLPREDYTHDLIVRPRIAGNFVVSSPNFSYRDCFDNPVRRSDFRTELSVLPASAGGPERMVISIEHAGQPLAVGEWDVLPVMICNTGESGVRRVVLTVSGPVKVAPSSQQIRLDGLGARQEAEVSFVVLPVARGRHVPIYLRTAYQDEFGRTCTQSSLLPVVVMDHEATTRGRNGGSTSCPATILYLAASPTDLPALRSDLEMREIKEQLDLGRYRDRFSLQSCSAARLRDIGRALIAYDPKIVHFSGHGGPGGSVYVEDEMGYRTPVPAEGLADLFKLHNTTVDCVIISACHSLLLAKALARHISHVIAMRYEIGDAAAITFSVGFYQGLAGGVSLAQAFERGCAFLRSLPMGRAEHETPVLI